MHHFPRVRAARPLARESSSRLSASPAPSDPRGPSGASQLPAKVLLCLHFTAPLTGLVRSTWTSASRVLELFAVSQGVIGIKGVHSNRFLAMNSRGRLYGTERFTDDCRFRERFQENSYNTYASLLHRHRRTARDWFVALNKRGKAKMGSSPRVKPIPGIYV
uniref:Fibroblast growth factor n=1 Tax=Gasterosteus aculeatus aculeatus TaxID=481459 RepID=A0AAQ4Q912_GASAC